MFHVVSDEYEPKNYFACDWTQTDIFKKKVLELKKDFNFISLEEAEKKLSRDVLRIKKYAVLTSDDGYRQVLDVIPFLEKEKIPLTMFVCPGFGTGAVRKDKLEQNPKIYFSPQELFNLKSNLVSIGLHGWEHDDATTLALDMFLENTKQCLDTLADHPRFVNYYAYPWGRHSVSTDACLSKLGLIPVLCDGCLNYKAKGSISRICIDSGV